MPYIWAQNPAQSDNLEPHNGFEYMIANKNDKGQFKLSHFSEMETTFSVPFDWASPNSSDSSWKLDAMVKYSQAQKGECDNDIQPYLTKYFESRTKNDNLYRQQGNAVALAAGGICQLVVPYTASVATPVQVFTSDAPVKTETKYLMEEGQIFFQLAPTAKSYRAVVDAVVFKQYQEAAPAPTCEQKSSWGSNVVRKCCYGLRLACGGYAGCWCEEAAELEAPLYK